MLARSFFDDPIQIHMFPDEARRLERCERMFRSLSRIHLAHDEVFVDENLRGASMWGPPGHWKTRGWAAAREVPAMVAAIGRGGFGRRGMTLLNDLGKAENRHAELAPTPHFYLAVLGTDPDEQGKGVGSGVISPVLDRADERGLGCYLESSKHSNVPYYERQGFTVLDDFTFRDGPTVWLMWRDPVPPEL